MDNSKKTIDPIAVRRFLVSELSIEEITKLASDFNLKFEELEGFSKSSKTINLIQILTSQGKLSAFVEQITLLRPKLQLLQKVYLADQVNHNRSEDAPDRMLFDLAAMTQEMRSIEKQVAPNSDIGKSISNVLEKASHAESMAERLSARLILPPQELTDINLVPVHILSQLYEYNVDENIATLILGLSGGATLGILVNWVTASVNTVTIQSKVVIVILILVVVLSGLWLIVLRNRSAELKKKMLGESK